MDIQNRTTRIFFTTLAVSVILLGTPCGPAFTAENSDKEVRNSLVKRTEGYCKKVLPAWFASASGIDDQEVKSLVTDCYMGYARLSILGLEADVSLADTHLSEVPAALLREATGIDLSVYRPLSGRKIQTIKSDD